VLGQRLAAAGSPRAPAFIGDAGHSSMSSNRQSQRWHAPASAVGSAPARKEISTNVQQWAWSPWRLDASSCEQSHVEGLS
jgi:hypothetical protein